MSKIAKLVNNTGLVLTNIENFLELLLTFVYDGSPTRILDYVTFQSQIRIAYIMLTENFVTSNNITYIMVLQKKQNSFVNSVSSSVNFTNVSVQHYLLLFATNKLYVYLYRWDLLNNKTFLGRPKNWALQEIRIFQKYLCYKNKSFFVFLII